ncbi:MAG: HupE/UreJ family protein [Gemmatimonadetes bacterium]|nr:HupE/UreJ family protein [Gemmatimonadota bacterium]
MATLVAALIGWARPLDAHEIPRSVVAVAYVKPEATRVRILVRIPLEAIRDIDFAERAPGVMDIAKAMPQLDGAARTWIADDLAILQDGQRVNGPAVIAVRLATPNDRAFATWADAEAQLAAPPLPDSTAMPWQRAWLDVALEAPVTAEARRLSIRPAFARLGQRTTTVLHVIGADGSDRSLLYEGDAGAIHLDPGVFDVIGAFVVRGFAHILDGIDHLLFLFALVIPFRRLRPLVGIVTAFTVAHSITLAASAAGVAPDVSWFPPAVEFLIALSIVAMALANILGIAGERRWVAAFGFGLVHGFGFSFALRESLQFAGTQVASALLGFNLGVEAGQLAVLIVLVPVLNGALKRVPSERVALVALSAIVGHSAWHWMTERWELLRRYPFELPARDAAFWAALMRGGVVVIVAGVALWGLSRLAAWLRVSKPEAA